MKEPASRKILAKPCHLLIREVQATGLDDVDVRIGKQVGLHDVHDVGMRINGQAGESMDTAHEFAIASRIVGAPAPALRRKEIASAEFRATIRGRLGHRATHAEKSAAATGAVFSIT